MTLVAQSFISLSELQNEEINRKYKHVCVNFLEGAYANAREPTGLFVRILLERLFNIHSHTSTHSIYEKRAHNASH